MPEGRKVKLGDLLTAAELKTAMVICERGAYQGQTVNQQLVAKVLKPEVMKRIDEFTKQENDARYLAYMIEAAFMSKGG